MATTAKAEYACLAMIELAKRYQQPKPVRLVEIAENPEIPQRFLVQILLQMKSAGLVQTIRGTNGGYKLARSPQEISLADILDVATGGETTTTETPVRGGVTARLHSVWQKLEATRRKILEETTLASLIPPSEVIDYNI